MFVTTDQIILILNYLFVQLDIDALSFYVYDAGFVIATSIARRPSTGKADRGLKLTIPRIHSIMDRIRIGQSPSDIRTTTHHFIQHVE